MIQIVQTPIIHEKVRTGYLSETEAIDIAKMILRENAIQVFKLDGYSDPLETIDVLQKPGTISDWWAIHKTNEGFVRSWKVKQQLMEHFTPDTSFLQLGFNVPNTK